MVDRPVTRRLPTQESTHTEETCTYIYTSNGIRARSPVDREIVDHTRLGQRGHHDQPLVLNDSHKE
jgi:hypothetical protein